jgi:radical SAM protein with 4Fe4S-binding SPASM domain
MTPGWLKHKATMNYSHPKHSIFAIQVFDQILLYAPLHDLAALVNRAAALRLRDSLLCGKNGDEGRLGEIASILNAEGKPAPWPKQGDLAPEFLGLLPTRGCNLACRYCGFLTADESHKVMDLKLARDAVNWYMDWVSRTGKQRAEVHFFGGEPFCAGEVLDLTVHLARKRAREAGCTLHFEAATNGVYSEERCRWAADNLHTIVLSLDGPADIQDQHRPYKDGRSSFPVVTRSAKILSAGAADLFFRSCVTRQTVDRMSEIATWFCQNFSPQGVSFEPVQPTAQSEAAQLEPPDPWKFARNFIRAAWILETHGMEAIYSSADVNTRRVSFCPAGQDVVIVSPDGTVSACYLLQRDWEAKGLDLRLGRMENGSVHLDADAVASARSLNVWNKPSCARCFCKWHCAGGCHVNHTPANLPGTHDRLCIQTRAITLRNILKAMGRDDVAHDWIEDREAMVKSVLQVSDLLLEGESSA